MMKYTLLLYHLDHEKFLGRLQELGLVDISVMDWTPTDSERELLVSIERCKSAYSQLKSIAAQNEEHLKTEKPFESANETLEQYVAATEQIEQLEALKLRAENDVIALRSWGEFDAHSIEDLRAQGVFMRFFQCPTKEYVAYEQQWSDKYTIERISDENGISYFVVITRSASETVDIEAQETKMFSADFRDKEQELIHIKSLLKTQHDTILRAAKGYKALESMQERLKSELNMSKVLGGGDREADGTLVILEGWATKNTEAKVDAFINDDPDVLVIKERPTPEDNPPVLLKNNKFSKLFEVIGNLYSLPNYHSMDLTAFFAPFYMIFFGFCLGDAGYGLLFVIAAVIMHFKMPRGKRAIPDLIIWCGLSTVLFGMLTGTFFGIELAKVPALVAVKDMFINQNQMFQLALYLGALQIIYAMGVKAYSMMRRYGFMYSVSTLGWMLVIISTALAMGLPVAIDGYDTSSPIFMALLALGLIAMLFMNNPKKNIFVNFGMGLWDMYNSITGFVGDLLSYIRLFALGLCSGIIASVFNSLAVGLSPDIPVIGIIVTILILLVGHSINIFMSTLGSFVHPLRLTFVEFYKNAGFEEGGRAFEPLKNSKAAE